MNEHRIAVPSDDLHGHYVLRNRPLPNGNKEVLHLQLSKRGFASYSLTEFDCTGQATRQLGWGESEADALRGENANESFQRVEEPISMEIYDNVCGR